MTEYPEFSVQDQAEQRYVGATRNVTMDHFAPAADELPRIIGELIGSGTFPAGPPFFRYRVIDMERELVVQVGVPVDADADVSAVTDGEVDVLPAGRYVTTTFTGHPDELMRVTGELLAWAAEQGLTFDHHDTPDGDAWACRLEFYETNPAEEPDWSKWRTTLAFKLA